MRTLTRLFAKALKRLPMNVANARAIYDACSGKVLRDRDIRHVQSSLIYSKEGAGPSDFLIDVCARAIKEAWDRELTCGNSALPDSAFLNVYPGEHYRLLNALVRATGARNVVEIGTFTGLGTLAFRDGMEDRVEVTTYDIIPWNKLRSPSHLTESDFGEGKITQVIGDLSEDDVFAENFRILDDAEIIFLDAPKDDVFEYKIAAKLRQLAPKPGKLLIIDDIQFVNMIDFWRAVTSPKLDVTSFGHWSGTGLVDLSEGFRTRD